MMRRPAVGLSLVLTVGQAASLPACAKRTDADVRRAWQSSSKPGKARPTRPGPARPTEDSQANSDGSSEGTEAPAPETGLRRVDQLVRRAAEIMAVAPNPSTIARLAQTWCSVEPEPQESEGGPVYICYPDPPVIVDGFAFTLELSARGVVGLVAADLPEDESRKLAEGAKASIEGQCSRPFQPTVARDDAARTHTLHSCPVAGGPMLVVGRYPRGDAGRWQVSISILGAG